MISPFSVLKMKIFGGSHEPEIGVELEGLPLGAAVSERELDNFLARRRSGKYAFSTPRKEADTPEFTEGLIDGRITGKIRAVIKNTNTRPTDYGYSDTPRPSHADYVSAIKYGKAFSGGGIFSGRMTAPLCIAGGIAKQILQKNGVEVLAYISEIAGLECFTYDNGIPNPEEIVRCHDYRYPTPDEGKADEIEDRLTALASRGDTAGGIIECVVFNPPVGLGGPLSDGLEGRLALSLYQIPAVKGVEFGLGHKISALSGTAANDPFEFRNGKVVTTTNNSGGINGGISNGMPITMKVSFRPTPSVSVPQKTVDLKTGQNTELTIRGRHDAAFLPRAVAAVESAAALVILDAFLENDMIKNK